MLTYFNFLPTDIIHCEIIPCLDYHSRTAFNITLDYDEKRMYPLNRDKIAQIEIMLATGPLTKAVNKASYAVDVARRRAILRLLDVVLPRNMILTQHNSRFRDVVENKIKTYIDPDSPEYNSSCQRFKTKMINAVSRLRVLLDTKYPYLYQLGAISRDYWSPIDGNNTNLVVTGCDQGLSVYQNNKTKYIKLGKKVEVTKVEVTKVEVAKVEVAKPRYRRRRYSSDYSYDTDYSY